MPEKPSESKDVADMLESLARRVREDPAFSPSAHLTIAPPAEMLDEGPSLGALDVFTDDDSVTVTVETRNIDASSVHVSLLNGRLLIGLGEGSRSYKRDLPLPVPVDEDQAVATFRNGVLDVVLPVKRR